MGNYAKGRLLEYAAKKRLEDRGFLVLRCAASRPLDLVAMKASEILLIECKTGSKPYVSNGELRKNFAMAEKAGGKAILCVRRKHHRLNFYEVTPSLERREAQL